MIHLSHSVPWEALGLVIVKISLVYWLIILGLKFIGRRAVGQLGPHEFILIALLAKIMSDGIITPETGFLGNLMGGVALIVNVFVINNASFIRRWVEGKPIKLLSDGVPDYTIMKKENVGIDDLEYTARKYGYESYKQFHSIILESDGNLSATLHHASSSPR